MLTTEQVDRIAKIEAAVRGALPEWAALAEIIIVLSKIISEITFGKLLNVSKAAAESEPKEE